LDVSKNKADVLDSKMYEAAWRGTEITGEIKGVQFNLSQQGPYEYIRRTAVANPHLKITLIDPEGRKTVFERASNKIPKQPKEVHPHPKGMDTDELLNLAKRSAGRYVGSFLMSDLSRVSAAKVDEIQKLVNFDLKKNPRKLSWPEAEQIIKAFEKTDFMAPPSEGLSPIGEDQIRKAILNVLKPEFEAIVARNPTTHSGGIPFQVEVAIAYGGNSGRPMEEGVKAEVMRFANRSPLLFDAGGCAITEAVNSVDWKRYGLRDFENSPITVFVNVVSTYIPYTSAGKQSISAEDEVIKEIRMAIMDVGRKFQMYHSRKRRDIEREARLNTLLKYSTELALAVSKITGTDEKKLLDKLDKLVRKKVKLMEAMENVEDEGSEENASVENGVSEEAEENA
jgi:DNA topoisomerase-6 subunit B